VGSTGFPLESLCALLTVGEGSPLRGHADRTGADSEKGDYCVARLIGGFTRKSQLSMNLDFERCSLHRNNRSNKCLVKSLRDLGSNRDVPGA